MEVPSNPPKAMDKVITALRHDNRTGTSDIQFPIVKPKTDPTQQMLALRWYGKKNVRVEPVPKHLITEPTDVVIRVTSTTICGSDLHLFHDEFQGMAEGYILGHEPMGIVEQCGSAVKSCAVGDRVVVSFPIVCGECEFCKKGQFSCCDTTNPSRDMEKLYGHRIAGILPAVVYNSLAILQLVCSELPQRFCRCFDLFASLVPSNAKSLATMCFLVDQFQFHGNEEIWKLCNGAGRNVFDVLFKCLGQEGTFKLLNSVKEDNDGNIFHCASRHRLGNESLAVLQVLVDFCTRQQVLYMLNAKTIGGNTPLHIACANGYQYIRMVEFLVKNGAEKDVKNDAYEKPVDLCRWDNCVRLVAVHEHSANTTISASSLSTIVGDTETETQSSDVSAQFGPSRKGKSEQPVDLSGAQPADANDYSSSSSQDMRTRN